MEPVLEIVCPYPDCRDCCSVVPFEPRGYSGVEEVETTCRVCKRPVTVRVTIERADAPSLELALRLAEEIAGEVADGHLTLMRFTTGWKAIYGTPDDEDRDHIWSLRNNATPQAALDDLVSRPLRRDQ